MEFQWSATQKGSICFLKIFFILQNIMNFNGNNKIQCHFPFILKTWKQLQNQSFFVYKTWRREGIFRSKLQSIFFPNPVSKPRSSGTYFSSAKSYKVRNPIQIDIQPTKFLMDGSRCRLNRSINEKHMVHL